jgi:hypothetical protein
LSRRHYEDQNVPKITKEVSKCFQAEFSAIRRRISLPENVGFLQMKKKNLLPSMWAKINHFLEFLTEPVNDSISTAHEEAVSDIK